jgi:bifunctional lysine-specific demethylase and histidyl-hydroxylase MINA
VATGNRDALAELLGSISSSEFVESYYERRRLLVRRRDRTGFDRFLTLDDVDRLLSESYLRSEYVRIVEDGKSRSLRDIDLEDANQSEGGLEVFFQRYRQGASIALLSLHERWLPLKELCRALTVPLNARMQANVYLTPPCAQALGLHYDTHDVFVLQVHGAKRWRLYEPWIELPLRTSPFREAPGAPRLVDEFILEAGDLLYLPRGHPHEVRSGDATSLHITLGVKPVLWAEVIEEAVRAAIDGDASLRRSLPPGFATDPALAESCEAELRRLLDAVLRKVPARRALDNARLRSELAAQPSLRGHLRDLDRQGQVDLETVVMVRRESRPVLTVDDGVVEVGFHGKRVRLPGHIERTLRYLLAAPGFTAADLPGDLDEASRLLLVRRLLHEGLLVRPAG